jgi:hypothetical protein
LFSACGILFEEVSLESVSSRPWRRVFDTFAVVTFEARDGGIWVHLREHGYEDSPVGLQDLLNRADGWVLRPDAAEVLR